METKKKKAFKRKKKSVIIGSREMPTRNKREANCNCISKCSCNCNNVRCSVFMG